MIYPCENDNNFCIITPWVFINEVEINCTCSEAFFYLCDSSSWPLFFPKMSKLVWTSNEPKQVGTTRSVIVSGIEIDELFLVWEHNKRYAFRFVGMNKFYFRTCIEDYILEEIDEGKRCKFTYKVYIKPHIILRCLSYFLLPQQQRFFSEAATFFRNFVNEKVKQKRES